MTFDGDFQRRLIFVAISSGGRRMVFLKLIGKSGLKRRLTPRVIIPFIDWLIDSHMPILDSSLTFISGRSLNLFHRGTRYSLRSNLSSSLLPTNLIIYHLDQPKRRQSFLKISFETSSQNLPNFLIIPTRYPTSHQIITHLRI